MSQKKRMLNVGAGGAAIPLPRQYAGFDVLRLDIDPAVKPEVLCDARRLAELYRHEVPKVLGGFLHVLKDGGFAQIVVPDIGQLMHAAVERKLDLEDVLYTSPAGPIKVLDVLWGYSAQIEASGNDFYAHRTGFTQKSLIAAVHAAGFGRSYSSTGLHEVHLFAFKGRELPSAEMRALLNIGGDA
jgi:hypothetical protein